MSTLNVTTVSATNIRASSIQDTGGSNGSTPSAIANGIAKAWVNFRGIGVVTIREQYNVSSITDNGTGSYTVNLTTAMIDANYCGQVSGSNSGISGFAYSGTAVPSGSQTVSTFGVVYVATGTNSNYVGAVTDVNFVHVTIFR
jgi:hypothetical protein